MSRPPDAALLALCPRLRRMAEEWQRLWDATPDDGNETLADRAFDQHHAWVWPGVRASNERGNHPISWLICLPARTAAGLRAKAAAVKAVVEASAYTEHNCRDDEALLVLSVLEDAARPDEISLGEARQQLAA